MQSFFLKKSRLATTFNKPDAGVALIGSTAQTDEMGTFSKNELAFVRQRTKDAANHVFDYLNYRIYYILSLTALCDIKFNSMLYNLISRAHQQPKKA